MPGRKKMILLIVGAALILAAVAAGVWRYSSIARSCNPPLLRQTIKLGHTATGATSGTAFDVEMATTMTEQSCGLSGRAGLGDREGMLFIFGSGSTQTFWMKDMSFALDIIWISGGRVAGFTQDVPPPAPGAHLWNLKLYTSPPDVDTVLEVNAGTVAKYGIQAGDGVTGL